MNTPTISQFAAFGRHMASYAAGAVTVGVGLHFLSPDQGNQIGTAVTGIVNGLESIVGGVATLISIFSALYAAKTASPSSQAASLGANPTTLVQPAPGGKATITLTDPVQASAALDAQKKSS